MILNLILLCEIIYKQALPIACTIMETRDYILKIYSYDTRLYDIKDKQEQSPLFEIIQDVDKKRQEILDNLLRKLKRHQNLLSEIKKGWRDKQNELEEDFADNKDQELMLSYYRDAFYIEKKRCIDILETDFDNALRCIDNFKRILYSGDFYSKESRNDFIVKNHEKQDKLCEKLSLMCDKWHRLLLNEEFNFNVPVFADEPDENVRNDRSEFFSRRR